MFVIHHWNVYIIVTGFLFKLCFSGKIAQPYLAPYSSSKFALDGFFSVLRQELVIDEIDVSVTICYIGLTGQLLVAVSALN